MHGRPPPLLLVGAVAFATLFATSVPAKADIVGSVEQILEDHGVTPPAPGPGIKFDGQFLSCSISPGAPPGPIDCYVCSGGDTSYDPVGIYSEQDGGKVGVGVPTREQNGEYAHHIVFISSTGEGC
jgi:hypothetical protein